MLEYNNSHLPLHSISKMLKHKTRMGYVCVDYRRRFALKRHTGVSFPSASFIGILESDQKIDGSV